MFTLKGVAYQDILDFEELDIPSGQTTCIVGESGGGKSTLLKLLNQMISPNQGEITFEGQSIDEWNAIELRRRVVMLPQNPAIYEGTIQDNLLIGRLFSERSTVDEGQLKKVLTLVNLNKELSQKADQLSGGERQRLALARIILMDPPVFLLDEPSSALDEEMEWLVMERFMDWAKANQKTVVMVTHAKGVARRFADRLINIKDYTTKGKLHASASNY